MGEFVDKIKIFGKQHIGKQYFILILSVVIGIVAGLAAYVLKTSVYYLKDLVDSKIIATSSRYWLIIVPGIGIFITIIFLRLVTKDKYGQGIPRILYAISKQKGEMKRYNTFTSLVGGVLTAGFGGSAGLESPIINTGSAVGSRLGVFFGLDYKTKTLLIGCGAAGAIASIFTTPVAGVIFGIEVLMLDLTTSSIIPLLLSSATGAITTKLLLSDRILFKFESDHAFIVQDLPWFIIFGILMGFVCLYFNRMYLWVEKQMKRIANIYLRAGVGVLLLGILIFFFPALYGEGYNNIMHIINGNEMLVVDYSSNAFSWIDITNPWVFLVGIILIVLLKVIATALTTGAGGVGGIFAPAAVTGGLAGFGFAKFFNLLNTGVVLSPSTFTLMGMAGGVAGIIHAPLTAIFLVAEITSGYEYFVPIMIVASISYFTVKIFDPHSIFNKELAERGQLITHNKDKTVLTLLNIDSVIDKVEDTVCKDACLGDLTKVISKSKRNMYPVIDSERNFLGIVILDAVREDMFKPEKYQNSIQKYMYMPTKNELVCTTDSMDSVMKKFQASGNYNLVVVNNGKYVGFVSRSNIFKAYRETLIDVSED